MGGVVPQKNLLYVTAFRDIGRGSWRFNPRTTEDYVKNFLLMAENFSGALLVFLEQGLLEVLSSKLGGRKNITFKLIDDVNTFYDTYMDNEKRIMNSKEYGDLIPAKLRFIPEHCSPEYTLMTNSKINFLADAQQNRPMFDYYAWIDFGFLPCVPNNDLLGSKLLYRVMGKLPDLRPSLAEMIATDAVYLCGSMFVVPAVRVLAFERAWVKKLEEFHVAGICDADRNVVLQIYYDNPGLFDLREDFVLSR